MRKTRSLALFYFPLMVVFLLTIFPSYALSRERKDKRDHSIIFENPLKENKFYKVTTVVDGDTISVRVNKNAVKVRLLGIDTPEITNSDKIAGARPKNKKGHESSRKLGLKAKDFMKRMTKGKLVRFEFESEIHFLDQYNRILAYVFLQDGTFLNSELIKQGYAQIYFRGSSKYSSEFENLQRTARSQRLGIWKNDHP